MFYPKASSSPLFVRAKTHSSPSLTSQNLSSAVLDFDYLDPFCSRSIFLGTLMTTLPKRPQMKALPSTARTAAPDNPARMPSTCTPPIYTCLNLVFSVCSSILPPPLPPPPPIKPLTKTLPRLDKTTVNKAPHAISTINSSMSSRKDFSLGSSIFTCRSNSE